MKYATRLNSFLKRKGQSIESALAEISEIKGITHVDINFPEHLDQMTASEMRFLVEKHGLKVNGVALRFPENFQDGEFTNRDHVLSDQAKRLCLEAVAACRVLGGEVITVWQAFDGYDYAFQVDYEDAWQRMREALREIAEAAAPDLLVSIEYKPFQPRSFSLIPNAATAMLMIEEIGLANVGVTLDFCHMLMAGENPATALALAAFHGRLMGIHLNDGYGLNDDGLMVGSVHMPQTLEFLYYARRYGYSRAVYFDTFPVREDPAEECRWNIQTVERLFCAIDKVGLERIRSAVASQNGMTAVKLVYDLMTVDHTSSRTWYSTAGAV